jgi:hypothetical protein
MKMHHIHQLTSATAPQWEDLNPEEIFETTKQMIGNLAPYLCFGVAQHEAWIKTAAIGATPDHDRCVRLAERHLKETDPIKEAVAVIHAGLLLIGALKAGVHPGDAGILVAEAMSLCLPVEPASPQKPTDMDY